MLVFSCVFYWTLQCRTHVQQNFISSFIHGLHTCDAKHVVYTIHYYPYHYCIHAIHTWPSLFLFTITTKLIYENGIFRNIFTEWLCSYCHKYDWLLCDYISVMFWRLN